MYELRYEEPATLDAAIGLIAAEAGDVRILAGGTDVLVQMHTDMIEPALLVNIKQIDEMRSIEKDGGGYRFGAAVTGMEMVNHPEFGTDWPGVLDGVKLIGSIQIKGRATVAGNLCNASPAADAVPPMMTAGAIAHVVGPNGARDIPVAEFTTGPGQTALKKGEIVVSFSLPERAPRSGDAYLRYTPRTEMDIAVVGVAINLTLDDGGTCTEAAVALGAVAEKALMVEAAGAALVGSKLDDAAMDNLAAAASNACRPIDDKRGTKEFRIKVAGVLAKRAAAIAATRAGA